MSNRKLTDNDIMPFGKYAAENVKMANVPASYLLWLYDQMNVHDLTRSERLVRQYIVANMDALKQDAKHG